MMIVGGLIGLAVISGLGLATWKAPRLTSVLVWSLLATIFVCSAILIQGPGSIDERALWTTLSVPIVWIVFQLWCYWDSKPWRLTGGLLFITLASGIAVLISKPLI